MGSLADEFIKFHRIIDQSWIRLLHGDDFKQNVFSPQGKK